MNIDRRVTLSADFVTIDGDTIALSAVVGARVESRRLVSATIWLALCVGALIAAVLLWVVGRAAKPSELPALILGAVASLVVGAVTAVLGVRAQDSHGVVLITAGGETRVGKPGTEKWASGVAQSVLAAAQARNVR
ncbi:MAG: hypothetical protein HOW73_20295 [Polyangiaceae bacterium]|nr:hypothetical protein [Polyangiaceae bacterium]